MAVLQFQDEGLKDWVRELNGFMQSSADFETKGEVLGHFYETAKTILRDSVIFRDITDLKEFVALLYQTATDDEYFSEKWMTPDGQIELFSVYNPSAVDTLVCINPSLVTVMHVNDVFTEAVSADIPDLLFTYDMYSGLYKYTTRASETNHF